jgi:hypothetical protein
MAASSSYPKKGNQMAASSSYSKNRQPNGSYLKLTGKKAAKRQLAQVNRQKAAK